MDRSGYQVDQALLALSAFGDFFAWLLGGLVLAAALIYAGRWLSNR